jgi:alkylation response protein AidB-like acyl-CoA dehydrogenase
MDLTYSDEQTALKDSAEKLLRERYTVALRGEPGAFRAALAEQGWLGVIVEEADGGAGLGMVEACLLAEAMGRHLCTEAFATQVQAISLIDALDESGVRRDLLAALVTGRTAFATMDHGSPDLDATRQSDGAVLVSGGATTFLDLADGAICLLVARMDGVAHLLRLNDTRGVTRFATVDGRTAGACNFERLPATDCGVVSDEVIACAFDRGVAVQVADICGAMQAALEATTAYAKMRVQFGQPIGANQVIKHRLVEMAIRCEEAKSLALRAAIRSGDGSDARTRQLAVSGAKAKVARMARAVMEDAVQIHGGMGVTDELEIGWYLKRALAFEASFGTPRWHRRRYGAVRATA